MGAPITSPPDPVAIVRQLDPDDIEQRLDEMEREREALIVLLRAARARRRRERKVAGEVRHE
jgi:hypothetical protein